MMIRVLGLDVGQKRIGIALSDPLGITAQGLETLHRSSLEKDLKTIHDLINQYEVTDIVVGLPKNMNNSIGFKAIEVEEFIEAFKVQCKTNVNIHWVDERLTTVQANHVLLSANVSRKKRKNVVDKLAATFILQMWLDLNK